MRQAPESFKPAASGVAAPIEWLSFSGGWPTRVCFLLDIDEEMP
jgi:hypothetical protein